MISARLEIWCEGMFDALLTRVSLFGRVLWLAIAASGLIACSNTSPAPPPNNTGTDFSDEYKIGVGDTLYVNVWRHEDLTLTVPVRPDGKISVPLAGDIVAGNQTPEQVGVAVTDSLSEYVRDPVVTVIVTQMGSDQYRSRVRVTGAVNRPTSSPYRQGMTVLDAVLEAGGVSEFANPSRAALYRSSGERVKIDLRGILNKGDMSTNYALAPGDVITVPERAF